MTDRIKQIATYFNLSSAEFADQVGVSRPVISHIFSGRNNPSLEVIQKIGRAFPQISLEWLLYGQGQMLKIVAEMPLENMADIKSPLITSGSNLDYKKQPTTENNSKNVLPANCLEPFKNASGKVIRIVFFYADNTFSEFKPSE